MKSKTIILLLLFASTFFTQCKKYEEDDVFIQWKKPEKRLIKFGPWKFDKLTVDGVDKSAEFRADTAYFEKIEFFEKHEYSTSLRIYRSSQFWSEIGVHEFSEENKILKIGIVSDIPNHADYHNYGPLFLTSYVDWEILRLSKKGMKIKTSYNGSEYILELKPQ